uniref:Uncharacterized protein n=1 Tax=Anguilla anguilla TaxID=7936 RepID=A0A0E9Q4N6_ANGAN
MNTWLLANLSAFHLSLVT